MLSVVIGGRNDGYGGDFVGRVNTSVRVTTELARRHSLDLEVVLVEWNPPADRPGFRKLIDRPAGVKVRFLVVDEETAARCPGADQMPMLEYVAKNVGIRRALGEWILATNADDFLSPRTVAWLAGNGLDPRCYYRVARTDVPGDLDGTVDEILGRAEREPLTRYELWDAPGDFLLMHRDRWHELKGYPEFVSGATIDSYMVELARRNGLEEREIPGPVFHQDHPRYARDTRPQVGWQDALKGRQNAENWGLAQYDGKFVRGLISILCPTRTRPSEWARMVKSCLETATGPVEVVGYLDSDDPALDQYDRADPRVRFVTGPRIMLTQCWNVAYAECQGEIVCQGNDDVVFRTPGWDQMVREAFANCPDKILLVHGSDEGQHFDKFGAHAFVHREWVERVGYFIPPYFSSDYGDAWINELANRLNRRQYVPMVIEHLHFLFGKAEKDRTTLERLARHERDKVDERYGALRSQRDGDFLRLLAGLSDRTKVPAWGMQRGGKPLPTGAPCPYCASTCTVPHANGRWCNSCGRGFA